MFAGGLRGVVGRGGDEDVGGEDELAVDGFPPPLLRTRASTTMTTTRRTAPPATASERDRRKRVVTSVFPAA